jgi:hypothetical protein
MESGILHVCELNSPVVRKFGWESLMENVYF